MKVETCFQTENSVFKEPGEQKILDTEWISLICASPEEPLTGKPSGMRRTRTSFSLNAESDYCFSKS